MSKTKFSTSRAFFNDQKLSEQFFTRSSLDVFSLSQVRLKCCFFFGFSNIKRFSSRKDYIQNVSRKSAIKI